MEKVADDLIAENFIATDYKSTCSQIYGLNPSTPKAEVIYFGRAEIAQMVKYLWNSMSGWGRASKVQEQRRK